MTLPKPAYLWMNGEIIAWEEGRVHVWSEVAVRGTSVFEGLRAFYDSNSRTHHVLGLKDHKARMFESCQLLRIPASAQDIDSLFEGMLKLVVALEVDEDLYLRPTVYINEGKYAVEPARADIGTYCVAFPNTRRPAGTYPIALKVSSWQRTPDQVFAPAIKSGGAYQAFRLPLAEAQEAGFDDAILLNANGGVTETCGATIFLVRRGTLITPELGSGVLESITRRHVLELAEELTIPSVEREVRRSELWIADELFVCGTLSELRPVNRVDHLCFEAGEVTNRISAAFNERVGNSYRYPNWFTPIRDDLIYHEMTIG